jgi:NADPH:quinone reductase-like Zn-dependent oxidoreductase
VNTRTGWYSKAVTEATTGEAYAAVSDNDPTWGGSPIAFPRIQGADAVGRVVAVGEGVDESLIGKRVMTDGWVRDPQDPANMDKARYFGSEVDGGFAEYARTPVHAMQVVNASLSDAELATFQCSYTTAEGMLSAGKRHRVRHRAHPRRIRWRGRCAGATGEAARRPRHRHGVRSQAP